MSGLCTFQLALHLTQRLTRGEDSFSGLMNAISLGVSMSRSRWLSYNLSRHGCLGVLSTL